MEQPKEVGVREVAEELDVQYITALTYIHRRQLLGVRRGGKWKVSREELDRFKKEGNHPNAMTEEQIAELEREKLARKEEDLLKIQED
jgi:excisionase family DNA binding protein